MFGLKKIYLLLCGILLELEEIRQLLTHVKFSASIVQKHTIGEHNLMAITAGGSQGVFQLQVSASDSSAVSLSNIVFTANDPDVVISADPNDASGATVDVTVPASDTAPVFTLTANATATSGNTTASVSASLDVTITPAPVPVTFKAQVVQVQ